LSRHDAVQILIFEILIIVFAGPRVQCWTPGSQPVL